MYRVAPVMVLQMVLVVFIIPYLTFLYETLNKTFVQTTFCLSVHNMTYTNKYTNFTLINIASFSSYS